MARRKVNKYVYRDGKTVLDTGPSSRLEPDINNTSPQLTPFWDQMPGRGSMGPHDNPNLAFLNDVRNNRTPLEDPTQTFLVKSIQGAYNMGTTNPGEYPLRLAPEMAARFPGPVPTNIAEAETALFNSFLPQALRFGSKMETTNAGMGDIISELWAPTNPKTPGFHDMVMGWSEDKGGVFQYMTNSLSNAAKSGKRAFSTTGMSLDPASFAEGLGGIVNGPDPDRRVAEADFLGAPAAYDLPEPKNWYNQLVDNVGERTVPTPFYAPKDEGMFIQDANGRTVINPHLTRNPGFVGTPKNYKYLENAGIPRNGYEQVSVTADQLAGYAQTLDAYYNTPKNERQIDFGTKPQVKGINKYLRGLNEQIQGMETISSDAQVIGAVAGAEDAFVRSSHPEPFVFDLTAPTHGNTQNFTLQEANALIAQRNPLVVNTAVETKYNLAGRQETTLAPDVGRGLTSLDGSNRTILENEIFLQGIRRGGLSKPKSIDPGPDEIVPVKSVNEVLWNTLQTFNSPTERLMLNAADEAMAVGRLLPGKIKRWKDGVTANEERLERASEWHGFDYVNPQLAKAQGRAWRQARGIVEVQERSKEQLVTDIDQDPSIPAEYKELAVENVLSGRSFGGYQSQRAEASMRAADRLTAREEAELAQLDDNGMRIQRDALDAPIEERVAAFESRTGMQFSPISGGSGQDGDGIPFGRHSINASDIQEYMDRGMSRDEAVQQAIKDGRGVTSAGGNGSQPPANNNTGTPFADPQGPNERPNNRTNNERTTNERVSDVGNDIELDPAQAALRANAREMVQSLRQRFPQWTPGRGRSEDLRALKEANPEFAAGHKLIMQDVRMSERLGIRSALQEVIENNGRGAASTSQPAPASSAGTPSSNGSGAGSDGSSTPAPGTQAFIDHNAQNVSRQQWEDAQREAVASRRRETESLREIAGDPSDAGEYQVGEPASTGAQAASSFMNAPPERIASGWRSFLKGAALEGLERRLIAGVTAENARGGTYTLREGYAHSEYGQFKPADPTDFSRGGEYYKAETGEMTINREQVGRGMGMINQAIDQAVNTPGLEGLTNREVAATLHKRVGEAINKIAENQLKEAERTTDGPALDQMRETIGKAKTVAYDMKNLGMSSGLKGISGASAADLANAALDYRDPADLKELLGSNPALSRRIEDLGGFEAVSKGHSRVLEADGQTYRVGQGGAGGRSDRLRSIYSTLFGNMMMAQFMGTMAWQQTGGAVLENAAAWGAGQYDYAALDNYGEGKADGPSSFLSRQQINANRTGSMAYEQWGFLKELGYAYGNDATARIGNDLKMAAGTGIAAGVGGWAVSGALGMGMAAATGVGLTAGGIAAAAVAVPALLGTGYNLATDQDSYSGWSPKSMLAAYSMMPSPAEERKLAEQGIFKQDIGAWDQYKLMTKAALGVGSSQEELAQRMYGTTGMELAKAIGTDPGRANWLFEGRDQEAVDYRGLAEDIMSATSLKEDVVNKELSQIQVAFGGLETESQRKAAQTLMVRSADLGVTAQSLVGNAANIAQMRGILTGTDEFQGLALDFANQGPLDQQKTLIQASRDYQKYAQWSGYLEGGNAEAYALFNQVGGTNAAQTQTIQSVLSQAQMSGGELSPEIAQQLAVTANGMKPGRALDISQLATQMSVGGDGYVDSFQRLAGAASAGQFGYQLSDVGNMASGTISMSAGNSADTMALMKGVASGNAYALSDYGRMAGIGALQSMDANGLQTGLKDMSGLLMYANQNVLGNQSLTGAQTLSGLGMTFNSTDQNSLLKGGIWGYQQSYVDQTNNLQAQQLGLQFTQLDQSRAYTYASWGLETQMNNTQWQQQQWGFSWQNTMLDTNNRFRLEDADLQRTQRGATNENNRWMQSFDYQTNLMRRDWSRDDYQFNTQMRELNFGWSMEDADEKIRRSSGYERAMLIKQRDRATLSNNLQSGQAEEQFERQEKLWEREDERYEKSLAFNEQMIQLDNERFELNQRQADEMFQLQKTRLSEEMEWAEKLRDLRLAIEALQRERAEQQLDDQQKGLELQRQMQQLQNEYSNNMTKINHLQTEQEATLRKITSYAPAFQRMLQDFLTFLDDASNTQLPTNGGTITFK